MNSDKKKLQCTEDIQIVTVYLHVQVKDESTHLHVPRGAVVEDVNQEELACQFQWMGPLVLYTIHALSRLHQPYTGIQPGGDRWHVDHSSPSTSRLI